jgi:hypothetical protein
MQCEEWADANSELFKEAHDETVHKNSYKRKLYELISASLVKRFLFYSKSVRQIQRNASSCTGPAKALHIVPYRRGTSSRFIACEALLSGLRILRLDKRRNLFPIQGNQKALRRGELFDCLDQNILRIPVNP